MQRGVLASIVITGLALLALARGSDGDHAVAVHPAGAAALQGDADCNGAVNPIDSLAILRHDGGVADVSCPERADTNCDDAINPVDSLRILRFDAGVSVAPIETCPSIGDPLSPTLSSEDLIDAALEAGSISLDESVLYKAYWAFKDPRLPGEFNGSAPAIGDVPDEIYIRPEGLVAETEAELDAFALPPPAEGSWYRNLYRDDSAGAGAQGLSTPPRTPPPPIDEWIPVVSPGGKANVWWDSAGGLLGDQDLANEVAQVVDGVWEKYQDLMGVQPLTDDSIPGGVNGGDGSYDIYIAPLEAGLYGYVASYNRVFGGTQPCPPRATFMVINNSATGDDLRGTLAHELFHSFQDAFTGFDACGQYLALQEVTAAWAEDFAFPDANTEHAFSGIEHNHFRGWPGWDGRGYSGFPYLMYLTRTHGADIVRQIFEQADEISYRQAIADVVPGGLEAAWKDFALAAWNEPPFDTLQQWDGIPFSPDRRNLEERPSPDGPQIPTYLNLSPGETEREYVEDFTTATPPLAMQYLFMSTLITGPGIVDANYIQINNPLFGTAPPYLSLQLLYRAEGETLWRYEDLTDKSHKSFCLDEPDDQVAELVLIISNGDVQEHTPLISAGPVAVVKDSCPCPGQSEEPVFGPAGVCEFSGTASWIWHSEEQSQQGTDVNDVSSSGNVTFRRRAAATPQGESPFVYDVVSGSITFSHRYEFDYGDVGCVETGGATIALEPGEATLTIRHAQAGGLEYQAFGAVGRDVVHVTAECFGSDGYEYDMGANWFHTGDWRPVPDSFILQGQDHQSSPIDDQTSNWHFTPTG